MKDVADVLSFFATDAGVFRFFALLFPGFVAVAIYDMRVPGERRKWGDMGVGLVAYSILIDVFAAAFLMLHPIPSSSTWQAIAFVICAALLLPAMVGWFFVDIREWFASKGWVLSAMPKAWDVFFTRIRNDPVALVITLKDGRKVGGFWANNPVASSYPADEDLLIPEPVRVDIDGRFIESMPDSKGLLISRDDILTIEAFDGFAVAAASNRAFAQRGAPATEALGAESGKQDKPIDVAESPLESAVTIEPPSASDP